MTDQENQQPSIEALEDQHNNLAAAFNKDRSFSNLDQLAEAKASLISVYVQAQYLQRAERVLEQLRFLAHENPYHA